MYLPFPEYSQKSLLATKFNRFCWYEINVAKKKKRYYPLLWATQNYFHYWNEINILGLSCPLVCYFTTLKTIETYLFFVINAIKIIFNILCEQTKTKRWHTVLWFPRSANKNFPPLQIKCHTLYFMYDTWIF